MHKYWYSWASGINAKNSWEQKIQYKLEIHSYYYINNIFQVWLTLTLILLCNLNHASRKVLFSVYVARPKMIKQIYGAM